MSERNQQQMFDTILRWQQSGLSQKAWCGQNNITYSSFHYWYRRFRHQQLHNQQAMADTFVQLVAPPVNPWCELALSKGAKVVFHQPVSAEFIRRLID